jgi:hypothetical protein
MGRPPREEPAPKEINLGTVIEESLCVQFDKIRGKLGVSRRALSAKIVEKFIEAAAEMKKTGKHPAWAFKIIIENED